MIYGSIILGLPSLFHEIEKKSLSLWFGFVRLKEQQWKNPVLLHFMQIDQIQGINKKTAAASHYNHLIPVQYDLWVWFALCTSMICYRLGSNHILPQRS